MSFCWLLELSYWQIGVLGDMRIWFSEVEFLNFSRKGYRESICQECSHWSRMEVRGSKMIRYHLSLNHELCHLETGGGVTSLNDSFSAFWESLAHRWNIQLSVITDWRASLAPAAGVISVPTVYIEIVAVMKCHSWWSARDNRSFLGGAHLVSPGAYSWAA